MSFATLLNALDSFLSFNAQRFSDWLQERTGRTSVFLEKSSLIFFILGTATDIIYQLWCVVEPSQWHIPFDTAMLLVLVPIFFWGDPWRNEIWAESADKFSRKSTIVAYFFSLLCHFGLWLFDELYLHRSSNLIPDNWHVDVAILGGLGWLYFKHCNPAQSSSLVKN